jgi:NAD(P)-dependent dehydrogenase (short-subunit alcohol dehydrogenase family)
MPQKVALIAGATRGIGLALVEALARHWAGEGIVYLTARRPGDGEFETKRLNSLGLRVGWLPFDLAESGSANRLAGELKRRHGGVDIAVQNGGYAPKAGVSDASEAAAMIAANNHGTLRFLRSIAPLMRDHGRLVIVASAMGRLANLPANLHERFNTYRHTPSDIDLAMDGYVAALRAGTAAAEGWPDWVNIPSKIGQVAVTKAFARQFAAERGVLINAACPGLTLTDATAGLMDTVFKGRTAQTPEQAAIDLLWLITLPPRVTEPYGELVQHRDVLPFGDAP